MQVFYRVTSLHQIGCADVKESRENLSRRGDLPGLFRGLSAPQQGLMTIYLNVSEKWGVIRRGWTTGSRLLLLYRLRFYFQHPSARSFISRTRRPSADRQTYRFTPASSIRLENVWRLRSANTSQSFIIIYVLRFFHHIRFNRHHDIKSGGQARASSCHGYT